MYVRTILIEIPAIRKELEMDVEAHNTPLGDYVKRMSLMRLLRNCHPLYRADYARKLFTQGLISKNRARLFTQIA
jgi:hypothetical protein